MYKKNTFSFLVSTSLLALMSAPSSAQEINYNDLEDLFGEAVTTSATGKPQRSSEAPASMLIITQDDIQRSGAKNVSDVLKRHVGIDHNQWSAGGSDMAIRGGNIPWMPYTLVMINGRQVYFNHFGFVNWSALPVVLDEIQQIEVVKGPMSAMFGVNAMQGVVNIITKNPVHTSGGSIVAEIGDEGQKSAKAHALVNMNNKLSFRLAGRYAEQDEFRTARKIQINHPESEYAAIEAIITPTDVSRLSVEASYTKSNYQTINQTQDPMATWTKTSSIKTTYNVDSKLGAIEAKFYTNWVDHSVDIDASGTEDVLNKATLHVAQLQDIIRVNAKNTARLSAEYRDYTFRSLPDQVGSVGYTLIAAGGMWENQTTEKLTLTAAGRVEQINFNHSGDIAAFTGFTEADFDRKDTEFVFNTAAVYKPDDYNSYRVNFGRSVHLPGLINMALAIQAGPVNILGKPDIPVTSSWEGEIAWDHKFKGTDTSLQTALFYRKISDIAMFPFEVNVLPPAAQLPTLTTQAIGDYESYGLEAAAKGHFTDTLRWTLNYTYNEVKELIARNDAAPAGYAAVPLGAEENTPKHKIKANLGYENGPLTIDLYSKFRSSLSVLSLPEVMNGQTLFPYQQFTSQIDFDAHVTYQALDNLDLFFTADNILSTNRSGGSRYITPARFRLGARITF